MRPKWMFRPCAKSTRRARLEVRQHLGVPDLLLHVVGDENRDELCAADGVGDRRHLEAGLLGRALRPASLAQADADVDAGVAQVQRVRVTLAAVADDRDLAVEKVEIAVAMNCRHVVCSLFEGSDHDLLR